MRRSVLLGTVVAVTLILGASAVAIAATRNCTANTPCVGTSKGDIMNGSSGPDDMRGRAGGDAMRGNGGSDQMEGGLGADRVLGGTGGDSVVWGGEEKGSATPFTYPDKSGDRTAGGPGADTVYGGFGQGGVDLVFGNGANDTIIVAQRGFPTDGEVKVTKEVVNCGTGEDTVYRDKGRDLIAKTASTRGVASPSWRWLPHKKVLR